MKQSKTNRIARIWTGAVVLAASMSMLVGAGGEAGGHGGGGGGGGGGGHAAAPAGGGGVGGGGGGGHVAAPSVNAGGQAEAHSGGNQSTAGRATVNRAGRPYNPYVPQETHSSVQNGAAAQNGTTVQNGVTARTETTAHHERGRDDRRADTGYGVVYGYPWYPFSYGWGDGWYGGYGTQYGYPGYNYNNNYPFDIPYDQYNNEESLEANPPNTGAADAQAGSGQSPGQATTVVNPYDQQSNQAKLDNAIDKSPEMVEANNSVAQAQSAFNTERERVLAALAQKPEYQAALARRREASKQVKAATTQSSGRETPVLDAAAQARLDAADEVTKMESQAVATDPAASAAKARLEQAAADRSALRAQLESQAKPQPK